MTYAESGTCKDVAGQNMDVGAKSCWMLEQWPIGFSFCGNLHHRPLMILEKLVVSQDNPSASR